MVKTLKTDRYSCLRYLQLAITNILNASLYIFAKPQNIVASKTEFHQKLQRACCVAFQRIITRKDEGITRNILAALYISIYLPLPRFDEELKRAKHEVIAYVCCFYNVDNLAYLQAMSSGFDKTWYQTKSNILEEFMLQQIKRKCANDCVEIPTKIMVCRNYEHVYTITPGNTFSNYFFI